MSLLTNFNMSNIFLGGLSKSLIHIVIFLLPGLHPLEETDTLILNFVKYFNNLAIYS